MRKKALLICLYTLVAGAFGSCFRWLQHLNAFEADTGLLIPGSPFTTITPLFIVLYALGLAVWVYWIKRGVGETRSFSLQRNGGFVAAGGYALGAVMLLGAGMMLISSGGMAYPVLMRILALMGLVTAVCMPFITQNGRFDGMMKLTGLCSMFPVAFSAFWLIVAYKLNASDPVVWDYAIEILTVSCVMLCWYYLAGFAVKRAKPWRTLFLCNLSAFMIFVALADKRELSFEVMFAATGFFFLLIALVICLNLCREE